MYEGKELLKSEIEKISVAKNLIMNYDKLDLDIFSMLHKGSSFRKSSQWLINDYSHPTYLISFYNSYRLNIVNPTIEKGQKDVPSMYLICHLELNKKIPDSIIRPATISSKLANLFIHFSIPLSNKPDFNKKYLIGTVNQVELEQSLSKNLINLISCDDDLIIEIKNNKCLMMYLHPIKKEDVLELLDLAEEWLA